MIDLTGIKKIALVGATQNPDKYGNIILRNLKMKNFQLYPVSPNYDEIDGAKVYKSIKDLPKEVELVVFVVPPQIGIKAAKEAYEAGFRNLWFQPGAESQEISEYVNSLDDVNSSFIDCIMIKT